MVRRLVHLRNLAHRPSLLLRHDRSYSGVVVEVQGEQEEESVNYWSMKHELVGVRDRAAVLKRYPKP